jgi:hypothetical protein
MLPGFTAEDSLISSRYYSENWNSQENKTDIHPAQLPCLYGRWCGPGCSGPGNPIDDVDACCKAHDECYSAYGYFSCFCDKRLLDCLRFKINFATAKGRAAYLIYAWFRNANTCPPGTVF